MTTPTQAMPTVMLTAVVTSASSTLSDQIVAGLGASLPTQPAPFAIPAASNINQGIKDIYNAVEPWVQYGFELADYALGWVPYVGGLSGQVMIFYFLGEPIVRSIVFNVDDWIFGSLPFPEGLRNVARDSWNALVQFGINQADFWLPPLPPIPPLPFAATQATATAATLAATRRKTSLTAVAATEPPAEKLGRMRLPVASLDGLSAQAARIMDRLGALTSNGVAAAKGVKETSTPDPSGNSSLAATPAAATPSKPTERVPSTKGLTSAQRRVLPMRQAQVKGRIGQPTQGRHRTDQ